METCTATSRISQKCRLQKIGEKVVKHQARKYGSTKFGLDRFVNGYLDLGTLWFMSKFGIKPMHFFGLLGSLIVILGFICRGCCRAVKTLQQYHGNPYILVTDSPYFYLSLVLMLLGSQLFLTGFIGELIVRNSSRRNEYEINEEITSSTKN